MLKNLAMFLAVVAGGCAMKMNGKTVGFGGGDGSTSSTPGGGGGGGSSGTDNSVELADGNPEDGAYVASSDVAEDPNDPQTLGFYRTYPHYPEAPLDPYLAVKDGQPVVVSDSWKVRATEFDCSARRDHCIFTPTWFFSVDSDRERKPQYSTAVAGEFTTDGVEGPANTRATGRIINEDQPYTAYKTVPATKKNLAKGTLIVAMTYPAKKAYSGEAVFEQTWQIGVVDRVDWDLNLIYLVGAEDDSLRISATRVCALSWRKGEKVQVVGGLSKDQIQVKVADVILPDPD